MKSERILVVDDDPSMRRVIEFTLAEHYQVRVAENGSQALESLATEPADLVITDVRMPSMDGMELLRRVRQGFPEVLVILLTAYGSITLPSKPSRAALTITSPSLSIPRSSSWWSARRWSTARSWKRTRISGRRSGRSSLSKT